MTLLKPGCRAIHGSTTVFILSIDGGSVIVRPTSGGRFFAVSIDQLEPLQ